MVSERDVPMETKRNGQRVEFEDIRRRERRRVTPGRAAVLAAVVLLAILALTALLLSVKNTGFSDARELSGDEFVFEAGTRQHFAAVGNGLAVASSTGLQLMDGNGTTIARQIFSMDTPRAAACGDHAVFYDLGGTALYTTDAKGECTALTQENAILALTANSAGYMALVTEDDDYRGRVTVYDENLSAVYEWYSGSGNILSAAVSPDSKTLAVLTADSNGSRICLYALTSETQLAAFEAPNELLLELGWTDDDRLCAFSSNRAVFLDKNCSALAEVPFAGRLLSFGVSEEGFAAFHTEGRLNTYDRSGRQLAELGMDREILSLSVQGSRLLALFPDEAALYTRSLVRSGSYPEVFDARQALLTDSGALLVQLYTAAPVKF